MIFSIVSDDFVLNPFLFERGKLTLIKSFDKAIELFEDANFTESKINETTYWCDDIDDFVKSFLQKNLYPIKPLITSESDFDFVIEEENEFLCLKDKVIYTLDKRIASYFNEDIQLHSQKNSFISKMRAIGILDFAYDEVIQKLRTYFKKEYKYYIPLLFDLMGQYSEIYDPKVFSDLIFAKEYLENIKIYNVQSGFNLKRDEKGLYLQCEYNDSHTGRIFPKGQSLQTLPKEQRNILVADDNCFLIDFDFNSFEINILIDLLGLPKSDDPHQGIINHLGIHAERDFGKTINYAYIYGMASKKICDLIKSKTGEEVSEDLLNSFSLFLKKPKVQVKNGIVFTHFGRPIQLEKEHAQLHNFISGTAADIFLKKFRTITEIIPSDDYNKIILQSHDSILVQLHNNIIQNTSIAEDILAILKSPIDIFTFDVGVKFGRDWGSLT